MTDIHCHIIPAVDDGVQSMEEALELIGKEASGGTNAFIATPHVIEKSDYNRLPVIAEATERLKARVAEEGIEVQIHLGGELYPTTNILEGLDQGLPLTMAGTGKYVLLDLPMMSLPDNFDSLIYELQVRGITPIVAHPERCAGFQQDPSRIEAIVDKGAALQVNVRSLRGKYGPLAQEIATKLLKKRLVQFVASDAHRASGHPILKTGKDDLLKFLDADYVDLLTNQSPTAVASGTPLPARPNAPAKGESRRNLFQRLLGK